MADEEDVMDQEVEEEEEAIDDPKAKKDRKRFEVKKVSVCVYICMHRGWVF